MALNQDYIGKVYPAGPAYEVGREKIREFATAIGDSNPVFHDPAAAAALGYSDIIAPPTFAIIVSLKAVIGVAHDPDLGLDYSRVVHGDQRFVYTRPICAGDELVATATIEDYNTFIQKRLSQVPGVQSIESRIVLEETKNTTELPLELLRAR